MKKQEATPAEQAANWWQSDEEVEGLEQALNDESLASEKSIIDAFLSTKSHQPTASWRQALLLVIGFIMGMLLLLGVGFIGWGLWRLPTTLAGTATPSSQVNLNSLLQIRGEMDTLGARLAAMETVQPTIVAALTTIQAQVTDLQRAPIPITTVPPTVESTVTPAPESTSTQASSFSTHERIQLLSEKTFPIDFTIKITLTVDNVVAIIDDNDEGSEFIPSQTLQATPTYIAYPTPTKVSTPGLLGGMHYLDLLNVDYANYYVFAWTAVSLDMGWYWLMVYIPENYANMLIDYQAQLIINEDDTIWLSIANKDKVTIDQDLYKNEWISLGAIYVKKSGKLRVIAYSQPKTQNRRYAGFDTVAILRISPSPTPTPLPIPIISPTTTILPTPIISPITTVLPKLSPSPTPIISPVPTP